MDHDAFTFPGAINVIKAIVDTNDVEALPEQLFWNMTSLQTLNMQYLLKLKTVPEKLFLGLSQLKVLFLTQASGLQQPLPDGLLKGLGSLELIEIWESRGYGRIPNMDDLKVRVKPQSSMVRRPCPGVFAALRQRLCAIHAADVCQASRHPVFARVHCVRASRRASFIATPHACDTGCEVQPTLTMLMHRLAVRCLAARATANRGFLFSWMSACVFRCCHGIRTVGAKALHGSGGGARNERGRERDQV